MPETNNKDSSVASNASHMSAGSDFLPVLSFAHPIGNGISKSVGRMAANATLVAQWFPQGWTGDMAFWG